MSAILWYPGEPKPKKEPKPKAKVKYYQRKGLRGFDTFDSIAEKRGLIRVAPRTSVKQIDWSKV